MAKLSVTERGQVTLRKEVLAHMGIRPGDKIDVGLLADGRVELRAARAAGGFRRLQGRLAGKTNGRKLSIDEIADATAESGAQAGHGET